MNIEHSDSPEPVDTAAAAETAAAPKRKPRARKPAEADPGAAAAPAVEAGAVTPAGAAGDPGDAAEAAKPARAPRKPRAPKAAADLPAAAEGPSALPPIDAASGTAAEPASPSVQEAAAKPARRPRTPAASRSEAAVSAQVPGASEGHGPAAQAEPAPAPAQDLQARPVNPADTGARTAPVAAAAEPTGPAVAGGPSGAQAGEPGEMTDGEPGDAAEQGAEGGEGGEGTVEGRRERSRNRRRGRRGSAGRLEAGDDGAGVPALPPDAVLAQPDSVMPALEAPDTSEVFNSLLSGDFDAEQPAELPEPVEVDDKRVLAPDPDAPKLHKVLAQSGIGSRRDMEQMIQEGRVSVNGETAHIGMRISFGDRIAIDGKPAKVRIQPPPPRIIAYHKPVGEVVTHDDPQQRPTVFRRLPRLQHGKWQSVGRLDINTEGLLLFTNSGDLANKLMHPRFGVEREYAVRVLGTLEKEARQQLLDGVTIEGQPAAFKSIEEGGGEGINRWYRVVITEGRNREVRKLFDAVGLTVSRLIRVRYGCVVLPRGLKRGVWVDLAEGDVKALRQLAGGSPPQQHTGQHPAQQGGAHRQEARPDSRRDGGKPQRPPQPQPSARRGNEPRQNAPDRNKPPREDRERRPRAPNPQGGDMLPREFREPGDPTRIPNPLQQTFDKRAMQRERHVAVRDELYEDGPIPNPLEQTYDKRFVQGQRGGGFGNPNQPRGGKGGPRGGAPGQPDPLKTAVGYIGADAFTRKNQGGRGGPRGGRRGGR